MATITGTDASERLDGTAENDTFLGSAGDDRLFGFNGDDSFFYASGNDGINGGQGNDSFNFTNFDDGGVRYTVRAFGQDGDDFLDFRQFETIRLFFEGGIGNDYARIIFGDDTAQFNLNMGDGDDLIEIGSLLSLSNLTTRGEFNLTLGAGQDTVLLSYIVDNPIVITDFETGASGDIFLFEAFEGLRAWNGADNLFATGHFQLVQDGADTILLFDDNGLTGGVLQQEITRFENTTVADFTAENFFGFAPDGSVAVDLTYEGTIENDVRTGSTGNDFLRGLAGNDTLSGYVGNDILIGSVGDDSLDGGTGNDRIFGGAGDDRLEGGLGNDRLIGGGGDDLFIYDGGNDAMSGSAGNDTFDFTNFGEQGARTIARAFGRGDDDVLNFSEFENIRLFFDGGTGNDVVNFIFGDADAEFEFILGDGDDLVNIGLSQFGSQFTALGTFDVSLGSGQDTVNISSLGIRSFNVVLPLEMSLTITDFEAGLTGDTLLLNFADNITNWNGQDNPFATGAARLLQVGDDTYVQFEQFQNEAGTLLAQAWANVAVLENVDMTTLTANNFGGFDPMASTGNASSSITEAYLIGFEEIIDMDIFRVENIWHDGIDLF